MVNICWLISFSPSPHINQGSIYLVPLTKILQTNPVDVVGLSQKAHHSPCAVISMHTSHHTKRWMWSRTVKQQQHRWVNSHSWPPALSFSDTLHFPFIIAAICKHLYSSIAAQTNGSGYMPVFTAREIMYDCVPQKSLTPTNHWV